MKELLIAIELEATYNLHYQGQPREWVVGIVDFKHSIDDVYKRADARRALRKAGAC